MQACLPGGFPVEQKAPALDAPRISRERTVIADHAMAGNGDGEIVRRARAGDRAHRLRRPDAPRDFGVGHGLADGNLLQRLPHPLLEGGAADVERKIQADPRRLDEADDPRDQSLIVAVGANETRLREAILEIADELLGIVSEQDRRRRPSCSRRRGSRRATSVRRRI